MNKFTKGNQVPSRKVIDAVLAYLNASNLSDVMRMVKEHQRDLFSLEADQVFDDLMHQNKDDSQAIEILTERQELLKQCVAEGIDKAFRSINPMLDSELNQAIKEFFFVPENWSQVRIALLKWQHILLAPEAFRTIDEIVIPAIIETDNDDEFARFIQFRRKLLEQTFHNGLSVTLEQIELLELADEFPPELREIVFSVASKEEAAAIVDKFPETWEFFNTLFSQNDPEWAFLMEQIDNIDEKIKELKLPYEMPQRIELCKKAIALIERRGKNELWAKFQGELANSYAKSSSGRRKANIELSLEHYQLALEVLTEDEFPLLWGMTHFNIGTTYNSRLAGDQVDNIELAIHHHKLALKTITENEFPVEWADIQHALGNCYLDRRVDPKQESFEWAIKYFEAACRVYKQESSDSDLGMVYASLGQAYTELDGESAIKQAVTYLNQALKIYTEESHPIEFARVNNSLASAYMNLGRQEDLKRASFHLIKAEKIFTRDRYPREFAGINQNLGINYASLGFNNNYFMEDAIERLQIALEVRKEFGLLFDQRESAIILGDLFFQYSKWEEARSSYLEAIEAGELLFADSYLEKSKRIEISKVAKLYVNATYSLLKMGHFEEALELFEQGKARLLAQALSLEYAVLDKLTPEERLIFKNINEEIKDLVAESYLSEDTLSRIPNRELSDLLKTAREKQKTFIEGIKNRYPDVMPKGPSTKDVFAIIPQNTALVAPLVTKFGTAVFLIPSGTSSLIESNILWLNDFRANELSFIRLEWLRAYKKEPAGESEEWKKFIEDVTVKLWDKLLGSIYKELIQYSVDSVIFIPQGGLQFLPLHAAWRLVKGERQFFLDDFYVSYAPSIYSLKVAQERSLSRSQNGAYVAGVGNYKSKPLAFSELETEIVGHILQTAPVMNNHVNKIAVERSVQGKAYLHFSCHGEFAWGTDALNSSLYLFNDEKLTLSEILRYDLNSARLATISACESGLIDESIPDEAIGLPAGLIQAGVASAVTTLWPIDELSTSLLMDIFYDQLINKGQPAQKALQKAQAWLREATNEEITGKLRNYNSSQAKKVYIALSVFNDAPDDKRFRHPYYWAAFTFTGA